MKPDDSSEAARLQHIWSGQFGDQYAARNPVRPALRQEFWRDVARRFPAGRMLEVGCNLGANLRPLAAVARASILAGIDVNAAALAELHRAEPPVRLARASALALPFPDASFDLVFTCGVLIHQSPEVLPIAMQEIVRCTRQYVLCAEYYAADPTEVPYRGLSRALFKADFGDLYARRFGLALRETRLLTGPGWDEVTLWILEKERPRE
jgi:pseudaminic acid biosynthesis-associated methylase